MQLSARARSAASRRATGGAVDTRAASRAARLAQLRVRVRAAASAASATHVPLASSSSARVHGPASRVAPCQSHRGRPSASASAASAGAGWAWPGSGGSDQAEAAAPSDELPRDIADLSLVLLVHENLRRRLGRGILPAAASTAPPAAAAAAAAGAAAGAAPPLPDVASALGAAERLPAALFLFSSSANNDQGIPPEQQQQQQQQQQQLLYANAAARELLLVAAAERATATAAPPPSALAQHLPRVAEDAPCAALRDVRWAPGPSNGADDPRPPFLLLLPRALACPVVAPSGEPVGRALLAGAWAFFAGGASDSSSSPSFLGRPGWPRVAPAALPSRASVRAAAEAVRAQADAVRGLKAAAAGAASAAGDRDDDPNRSRGSPANRDPAVVQAVAELGALKNRLAEVEAMRAAFFFVLDGEEEEGEGEDEEEEGAAALAAAAERGEGGELMRDLLRRAEEAADAQRGADAAIR